MFEKRARKQLITKVYEYEVTNNLKYIGSVIHIPQVDEIYLILETRQRFHIFWKFYAYVTVSMNLFDMPAPLLDLLTLLVDAGEEGMENFDLTKYVVDARSIIRIGLTKVMEQLEDEGMSEEALKNAQEVIDKKAETMSEYWSNWKSTEKEFLNSYTKGGYTPLMKIPAGVSTRYIFGRVLHHNLLLVSVEVVKTKKGMNMMEIHQTNISRGFMEALVGKTPESEGTVNDDNQESK